jgi:hypothetical protein
MWILAAVVAIFAIQGFIKAAPWLYAKAKTLKLSALPKVPNPLTIQIELWKVLILAAAVWLSIGGTGPAWKLPTINWPFPSIIAPAKATAATYVYEKDQGGIPPAVASALDTLNRRTPPVSATPFEQNTTDGTGDTPEQYKLPLEAAKKAGLPALVVMADKTVIAVVKAPTTVEQVLEAVK